MDLTIYATEVAARLLPADRSDGTAELLVTLVRELAKGRPVQHEALGATLGWPAKRVAALLERQPCTEYDSDGNVIGHGITLNETAHACEIDGRRLYTWCALDALMFPAMIGRAVRALSHCPATRLPVSLTISPDEVRDVEPASVVVSLPRPDSTPDIRSSFCCHANFYASASAARRSIGQGMELLCVEDAFRLGRLVADLLTAGKAEAPTASSSDLLSLDRDANP